MFRVTSQGLSVAAAVLAAFAWIGPAGSRAQQKTMEEPAVDLQWAVKIPMRDGVKLNATVFTAHGQKGPLPVIFTFTPYIGDSYTDRAVYFAKHGYVYALVDVRGRGNSGGEFWPFENEGRDGYDVVEWLANQPYCNGKVTMWGGSYAGFRSMDCAKGVSAAPCDDRSGGCGASRCGFSFSIQHFWALRYAMADVHQRGDE
ncbi:MAG TPA: CocE/NonD family hydrolase [Candidatus Acidoferrum sp.]|nr:CocE/NonD family hydrolase [Candidatus Acidoferrum sp.]